MKVNKLLMIMLGALVLVSSCKKKRDDVNPIPDAPAEQNPPGEEVKIFRPKRVYYGTDSLNLELLSTYSFDKQGRLDTTYYYDSYQKGQILYHMSIFKYSGDTTKGDGFFLNIKDNKLYKGGSNYTVYNSNKLPVQVYSYGYFYHDIIKGIENNPVHRTTDYIYTYRDSLTADVKTKGYNSDSSMQRHVFYKNGNIAYSIVAPGDTLKFTKYEKTKGRFLNGIDSPPFYLFQSKYSDYLPVQWYNTIQGEKHYKDMKWEYNKNGLPVNATLHSGPYKVYYRFEY